MNSSCVSFAGAGAGALGVIGAGGLPGTFGKASCSTGSSPTVAIPPLDAGWTISPI